MTPWLNYHHLFYFKTIAEEGSVSKASEKLRLGQPTLSAQLKQFEDSIGVKLFERHHKKLTLTEQGKVALDYAQNIFKVGNEMIEALHDRLTPNRVHLQIGALDGLPKDIILKLTRKAIKIGPCSISLHEGKTEELLRELASHRLDLFVTNFIPNGIDTKVFSYKSITKAPLHIYGSKQFRNLKNNFPQSLNNQPIILPTHDSKMRQDLEHWSKANNINFSTVAEAQDVSLKTLLAQEGLGVIPTTQRSVESLIKNKIIFDLGRLQGVSEEIFIITALRKMKNPIANAIYASEDF